MGRNRQRRKEAYIERCWQHDLALRFVAQRGDSEGETSGWLAGWRAGQGGAGLSAIKEAVAGRAVGVGWASQRQKRRLGVPHPGRAD